MSLPLSRNTSYNPSAKLKSADVNDLQDCVVVGAHGSIPIPYDPTGFVVEPQSAVAAQGAGGDLAINGSADASCGMRLPAGTKIETIQWFHHRNAGSIVLKLLEYDMVANTSAIKSTFTINSGTTRSSTLITLNGSGTTGANPAPYTVPTGKTAQLLVTFDTSGQKCGGAIVTITRPLP